jgi:AcrR family transcriptional regulator
MAASKSAGRPQKDAQALSKQQVLSLALPLIQKGGTEAISFRLLAEQLDVTPMAVKYHVGDKHSMLRDLVEMAFKETVDVIDGKSSTERLRNILSRYCARAIQHANLVRCMLDDPSLMSAEIKLVTEEVRKCTRHLYNGDVQDTMLNLLVDYTHGFGFSMAASSEITPTHEDFMRSLGWVLRLASKDCTKV